MDQTIQAVSETTDLAPECQPLGGPRTRVESENRNDRLRTNRDRDLRNRRPFLMRHPGTQESSRQLVRQGQKNDQFGSEHCPITATTSQDAMQCSILNQYDYLPLDQFEELIAATLALIYPLGVGIMVPGERHDKPTRPMIDYQRLFDAAANRVSRFKSARLFIHLVQPEATTP
jgi:arginine/lysine/ornithine decarboxylase